MKHVLPSAWVTQPWKNGGGVTHEILRDGPPERFRLRVSLAEVSRDGPFSRFDEVDRVIVLVEGRGFTLHGEHTRTLAEPGVPHAFAGEEPIQCALVEGPVRDLNLMVDRRRARLEAERVVLPAGAHTLATGGGELLVFVLAGSVRVGSDVLPTHALVHTDAPLGLEVPEAATLVVARVLTAPDRGS